MFGVYFISLFGLVSALVLNVDPYRKSIIFPLFLGFVVC